jgi:heterodisulfide reductase subunit A-like polyferredoxin
VAEEGGLVARPFRDEEERVRTEGICFCCDDCCAYFLDPTEVCDRGDLIETTGRDECDDCGLCVEACRFGARSIVEGALALRRENCYGCGLCVGACPRGAVRMVRRQ